MSHDRHRVQEDLRGVVVGEVLCNDTITSLYARDAGPFSIRPLGVVRPRHVEDVVQVVKYAEEHRISLHARGAATSSAAQSLGPGIVLDFSRFMRRVIETSGEGDGSTITVEPGAVVGEVNRRLARENRTLGYEPWSNCVSTVGGALARNAAGRYLCGFGRLAERLIDCEVVLADGSIVELGRRRLEPDLRGATPKRLQHLVRRVSALLVDYGPRAAPTRTGSEGLHAGMFDGVLGAETIDLARLMAGSEGTLALFTRLTLRTSALPKASGMLPLYCGGLQEAAEAAMVARRFGPAACDLLDRRHLTIAREADVRYEMAIPAWAEAALFVELHGDDEDSLTQALRALQEEIARDVQETTAGDIVTDLLDLAFYRDLAANAPHLLHRMGGRNRPVALAEELVVAPDQLGPLIAAVQSLLQQLGVTASIGASGNSGRLQVRPFLDLAAAEDRQKVVPLSKSIAEAVWDLGGALGGNAACALLCGSRFARSDTATLDALREIKRQFDADSRFNPNRVVPTRLHDVDELLPSLESFAEDDSTGNGEAARPTVFTPEFGWAADDLHLTAAKCSGCGICRAEQGARMCPINHIAPREEASPRAKANLILSLLRGASNGEQTEESDVKRVADLCVHCHMCRLECPAEVDIPRLMAEAKAQHVSTNSLRFSDWLMVHVDGVAGFARRMRHLANWVLGNRVARWMLEKATGIAQSRRLPMLPRRSFLEVAKRRRLTVPPAGDRKVAFFIDTYVNHFDVELGLALAAVLEHNGVMVWVPPEQRHAGMPMISRGALEPAREVARHNAGVLAEAVRQGFTIVATEPSAVLALTREYPALFPSDPDVESVAEHTVEACQFLWRLHQRQQLRLEFKRVEATLGYHAPCHLVALRIGTPAENLLRLIPGLGVERLEHGCSGMAGTFGLQRKNFRRSLRMGLPLLSALRKKPLTAGATECSTCRIQMQHGTDRPTIHPIKVMALAYGLMPELKRHLFSGGRELTL